MSKLSKALTAAAGNAGEALYVEDVFSTYLYEGTEPTDQTITNGIDLDGEGGLVWIANRSDGGNFVFDTERGAGVALFTHNTSANQTYNPASQDLMSFNSDGFTVGDEWSTSVNRNGEKQVSWTFRKAEKFFDVVTYSGNGVAGRAISHNLGTTPGFILVKSTNSSQWWAAYHTSLGADYHFRFNENFAAFQSLGYIWGNGAGGSVEPTDTNFTVYNDSAVNGTGKSYVAYLFASDAGGFGDDGSESIIKCGSYTGNGSSDGTEVDLGFEPQWLLVKGASSGAAYSWALFDNMRGVTVGSGDVYLEANTSNAESSPSEQLEFNATGFKLKTTGAARNASGETYIYIAIRRPMKTPESGTEVFDVVENIYPTESVAPGWRSSFTVDMTMNRRTGSPAEMAVTSRLQGGSYLVTSSTYQEQAGTYVYNFGYQTGAHDYLDNGGLNYAYMFKRATGFFDVVAWTGDGVNYTHAHNLGVVPELMILKTRGAAEDWWVYHKDIGADYRLSLQSSAAKVLNTVTWQNTAPTSAEYSFGNRTTGRTYISYLFASVDGVSKVGSYTGTGSNVDVDCGFSAGARFILIKRTDSTGDWYVYDSERGIVTGNDPYLLLNSTAAEVTNTDYIDPLSSGFTVTSSAPAALNASGGSYIFLAIS